MSSAVSPTAPLPAMHIGTMGWSYTDWNGVFYPSNVDNAQMLGLYARRLNAVEIDSTFYGTPRETVVRHWAKTTPEGFVFCAKVPRLLTHDMALRNIRVPLTEFVRVMRLLGPKRGPMLFQLGPSFTSDNLPALEALLPLLRELEDPDARFAVEVRHRSLLTRAFADLLAEHQVALAATDYAGMPRRFVPTTDFMYLRLIGKHGQFKNHRQTQTDRSADVRIWADVLRENAQRFSAGYLFCNNDYEGYSPATCSKVKEALGLPADESSPEIQGSLF